MTSSVACANFHPNLWRQTICANCMRPKSRHESSASEAEEHIRSRSSTCTGVPEEKLPAAGSGAAAAAAAIAVINAASTFPDHRARKEHKVAGEEKQIHVGVVRPYAVVEIEGIRQLSNARSVKARSLAPSSSQLSSSILRRRAPTCFPLPTGGSHKNADTVTSIPGNSIPPKPRATPRRKVPQPPLPRQMNKSPHTNLAVVSEANGKTAKSIDQNRVSPAIDKRDEGAVMEPAVLLSARCTAVSENKLQELEAKRLQVSRAAGRVVAALRSKPKLKVLQEGISTVSSSGRVEEPAVVLSTVRGKRTAPKKPPRTPSTFLEFTDKLSQSASGNSKENTLSNSHLDSYSNWLQAQLAKLMEDVVQRVYAKFLELVLRPDPMWKVSWQQLQLLSPNTAIYKGVEMSLQKLPKKLDGCTENDIRISQRLLPHPNLCLVRAILPPPALPSLSASYYILRDGTSLGTLAQLLPEKREASNHDQFQELLLFCLVQIMSAVNYLYSNGVCHRDVNMNCVLVSQYGYHWLLKMGNFNYAVYRSGPVTATSFIYGYQELRWLGGTDSCLPPEILNTPENAQSLDYSGTDSFAIGCLIYDMYGLDNPFEKDPQLVFTQYKTASLPLLPASMVPLQRLLRLLLCWDPCHRLSPSTALLLCQALLWLPEPWLKSPPSDLLLRQQLDYDCVSLVAAIATMDLRPVPLPHVLHANFLNSCNVSELVRALFVFQSYIE